MSLTEQKKGHIYLIFDLSSCAPSSIASNVIIAYNGLDVKRDIYLPGTLVCCTISAAGIG